MLYTSEIQAVTNEGIRRKLARYDAMEALARLSGHVFAAGFLLLFLVFNGPHLVPLVGGCLVGFGCEVVGSLLATAIQCGNAEQWRNVYDRRIEAELRGSGFS